MRQFQRGDEADSHAQLTSTCREVIVTARDKGVTSSIELEPFLTTILVKCEITLSDNSPNAKAGAARHRLRKPGHVRPHISMKFADYQIAPVTTGPFGRRFFEPRAALSTPGA